MKNKIRVLVQKLFSLLPEKRGIKFLLKLLDKLAVSRKKYKYYNYSLLSKLLLIEEKLIKKILKS